MDVNKMTLEELIANAAMPSADLIIQACRYELVHMLYTAQRYVDHYNKLNHTDPYDDRAFDLVQDEMLRNHAEMIRIFSPDRDRTDYEVAMSVFPDKSQPSAHEENA